MNTPLNDTAHTPTQAKLGNSDIPYMLLTLEQYKSLKAEVERLRAALKAVSPLLSDETTAQMEPDGRYVLRPKMSLSDLREAKRKVEALSLVSESTT